MNTLKELEQHANREARVANKLLQVWILKETGIICEVKERGNLLNSPVIEAITITPENLKGDVSRIEIDPANDNAVHVIGSLAYWKELNVDVKIAKLIILFDNKLELDKEVKKYMNRPVLELYAKTFQEQKRIDDETYADRWKAIYNGFKVGKRYQKTSHASYNADITKVRITKVTENRVYVTIRETYEHNTYYEKGTYITKCYFSKVELTDALIKGKFLTGCVDDAGRYGVSTKKELIN